MSMDTWQRNISGMIAHAQRKVQTLQGVDAAITKLLCDNAAVNFNTVSKEAAATKQYLYANEQVRGRIEVLRGQHRERALCERLARPPGKTEASKDMVILTKDRRIAELEDDVRRLKKELQGALGKLYERA